jgi:hypothetical protein
MSPTTGTNATDVPWDEDAAVTSTQSAGAGQPDPDGPPPRPMAAVELLAAVARR